MPMGALPSTDNEGYKSLRERIDTALKLCKEESSIDFKKANVWDELKDIVIKTSLAMANLRDGGIIIVGVQENSGRWEITGLEQEQVETFDPDVILDQVNRYASPPISLDIVTHALGDGKILLVININEFDDKPIVCQRNKHNQSNELVLREGAVYVRPIGKAETTEVKSDRQMHELLDLSSEKMTRKFLEKCGRVGIGISGQGTSDDDKQKFDEELAGL